MDRINPYIENFIRKLVEKKGETLEPDEHERLIEGLNRLFENMVGRNMVKALPEEVRRQFVSEYDKGSRHVDASGMSEVFDRYIEDPAKIIKETLAQFTELYFLNMGREADISQKRSL